MKTQRYLSLFLCCLVLSFSSLAITKPIPFHIEGRSAMTGSENGSVTLCSVTNTYIGFGFDVQVNDNSKLAQINLYFSDDGEKYRNGDEEDFDKILSEIRAGGVVNKGVYSVDNIDVTIEILSVKSKEVKFLNLSDCKIECHKKSKVNFIVLTYEGGPRKIGFKNISEQELINLLSSCEMESVLVNGYKLPFNRVDKLNAAEAILLAFGNSSDAVYEEYLTTFSTAATFKNMFAELAGSRKSNSSSSSSAQKTTSSGSKSSSSSQKPTSSGSTSSSSSKQPKQAKDTSSSSSSKKQQQTSHSSTTVSEKDGVKTELITEKNGFQWYEVSSYENGEFKYGAKSASGKWIIPLKPAMFGPFTQVANGTVYFILKANTKCVSLYDASGKLLIPESRGYQDITAQDGCFQVTKDKKMGICNLSGKELIKPSYEYIFSNGDKEVYYIVSMAGGKKGVCDEKGHLVIEPIYKEVYRHDGKKTYYEVETSDGKVGACDEKGRLVIEPIYKEVCCHDGKKTYYEVKTSDGKVGACDEKGRLVLAPNKLYSKSLIYIDGKEGFKYKADDGKYVPTYIKLP